MPRRGKGKPKYDGPVLPRVLRDELDVFDDGGTCRTRDDVKKRNKGSSVMDRKQRRAAEKAAKASKRQASAQWKADAASRRRMR